MITILYNLKDSVKQTYIEHFLFFILFCISQIFFRVTYFAPIQYESGIKLLTTI